MFLGLNFDVFTEVHIHLASNGLIEAPTDSSLSPFLQICYYLDIADLISLARVDKDLHRMLAEEGGSIWKKARERAGFASLALPPDMSEPQIRLVGIRKVVSGKLSPTLLPLTLPC